MTADDLKVAISVLPELTERKRIIDNNLQLSTALLEEIKKRNLGDFFRIEQDAAEQTRAKILQAIRSVEGSPADKMRLFLVFFLGQEDVPKEEMGAYEAALRDAGCDLAALEYCKKAKSFLRMTARSTLAVSTASKGSTTDFLQSFGSRFSGGVLGNMLSSVKNLLPESADTPITKLVDAVVEVATGASLGTASAIRSTLTGSASSSKEDLFTVFDPKASRSSGPERSRTPVSSTQRSAFNHLIVFVVGGSNYAEYNHVEEFVKASGGCPCVSAHLLEKAAADERHLWIDRVAHWRGLSQAAGGPERVSTQRHIMFKAALGKWLI